MRRMLPDGVTLHTTRLRMDERDANSMLSFIDHIEDAASLLKDAGCQHILVNCTAVTTADPTIGTRIADRIKARPACRRARPATGSWLPSRRCAPAKS